MSIKFQSYISEKVKNAKSIIVDMDDTLIYTSYANFLSYRMAVYETLGVYLSHKQESRFTKETLYRFFPTLCSMLLSDIISAKNEIFETYLHTTRVNHLLVNILKRYKDTKQIILLTNSKSTRSIELLKYHSLYKYFDIIIYNDPQINSNKYQTLIDIVDIDIKSCVVLENEIEQITYAKQVGIKDTDIIKI